YVLGAVQSVYRRYGEDEADYRPLPPLALVGRVGEMGQKLFAPPNVKGWPGGRSWLNTSTMLERDNFAAALALGALWDAPRLRRTGSAAADAPEEAVPPPAFDPARLLREEPANRPEDVVRVL